MTFRTVRATLGVVLGVAISGCGAVGGPDYQGGALIDPAGAVTEVSHELIAAADPRAAGDADMRGTVDGRTITITRAATSCGQQPDVRVDVDGTKLTASLVLPPEGQPCPVGQNYLVILTLGAEYESYQVG